jgi:magnesium-transporting ATPase (P-type)
VYFFVLDSAGWQYGTRLDGSDPLYLQATSACLATIVVMQMVNVFLCRHPLRSSLNSKMLGNRLILLGLAAESAGILFVIYTPAGNWLFGAAPIGAEAWLLALACALLMGISEEGRKAWLRRVLTRTVSA